MLDATQLTHSMVNLPCQMPTFLARCQSSWIKGNRIDVFPTQTLDARHCLWCHCKVDRQTSQLLAFKAPEWVPHQKSVTMKAPANKDKGEAELPGLLNTGGLL